MVEAKFLVHDLLIKIQTPNTESKQRRAAEKKLSSLAQQPIDLLKDLASIILEPNINNSSKFPLIF